MPQQFLYGAYPGVDSGSIGQSNAANQTLYNNTISGYGDMLKNLQQQQAATGLGWQQVIGQYAGAGVAAQNQLQQGYQQNRANQYQGYVSRGLGNSTVLGNADQALNQQYANSQLSLADQQAQGRAGLQSQFLDYTNQANQQQAAARLQKLNYMQSVSNAPAVDPSVQASLYNQQVMQEQYLAQQMALARMHIGAAQQGQMSAQQSSSSLQKQMEDAQAQLAQQQAANAQMANSNKSQLGAYRSFISQLQGQGIPTTPAGASGGAVAQNINLDEQVGSDAGAFGTPTDTGAFPQASAYGGGLSDLAGAATGFAGAFGGTDTGAYGNFGANTGSEFGGSSGGYGDLGGGGGGEGA